MLPTFASGLLFGALLTGCAQPASVDDPRLVQENRDLDNATPDLRTHDLGTTADLTAEDLATNEDLSGPHDLSHPHDLAHPADLSHAPDLATPACNPGGTTIGASGGQDSCAYGDYCQAGTDACVAAPVGSCSQLSGAPSWNTGAEAAPVIMSASAVSLAATSSTTECAGGDPAGLITINYYAPTPLSSSAGTLATEARWKVSTTAGGSWYSATFIRETPASGAHVGQIQIGVNCGKASNTAGLYLVDSGGNTSNVVCVSW